MLSVAFKNQNKKPLRSLTTFASLVAAAFTVIGTVPTTVAQAGQEFVIYSTYRGVDLGGEKENSPRDYYINMGSENGVRPGSVVEVWRKVPTYDLSSQKLYKDLTFPIARMKVIHVETNAAVARLDILYPPEKAPAMSPRAVMVGDQVRVGK